MIGKNIVRRAAKTAKSRNTADPNSDDPVCNEASANDPNIDAHLQYVNAQNVYWGVFREPVFNTYMENGNINMVNVRGHLKSQS